MTAVTLQSFDSEAFALPYYRITAWDPGLGGELAPLLKRRPIAIDAKVPAADTDRIQFLGRLGFRSVAMQIVLRHGLGTLAPPQHDVTLATRLELADGTLDRHAGNFRFDRFSCDPLLPRAGRDRVYGRWIASSLAGRAEIAFVGENFCTFRCDGPVLSIDLLSVLDQRQGIGRSLVLAVLAQAKRRGMGEARVVTECANEAAWRLYDATGFAVETYLNCLHFVAA